MKMGGGQDKRSQRSSNLGGKFAVLLTRHLFNACHTQETRGGMNRPGKRHFRRVMTERKMVKDTAKVIVSFISETTIHIPQDQERKMALILKLWWCTRNWLLGGQDCPCIIVRTISASRNQLDYMIQERNQRRLPNNVVQQNFL